MTSRDDLTLSITSLQRPSALARTLESAGDEVAVQVILNGARAGEYDAIESRFPGVRFISNQANLGVAAAWNQGVVTADTRYVVLSGDDLRYEAGWVGAVCDAFSGDERPSQVTLSNDPAFSSFALDKSLVVEQGWFDEHFSRVYYEDEDWWLRSAEHQGRFGGTPDRFDVIPPLGVVWRDPNRRAAWNSIPNRFYFWRKWERVREPRPDTIPLRAGLHVRRRRLEPAWPRLEDARLAYATGHFAAREYRHTGPGRTLALLTHATTNRPVIAARRMLQRWRNPDQELR